MDPATMWQIVAGRYTAVVEPGQALTPAKVNQGLDAISKV
eukprot:COSAG01_NODE_23366_length_818_cov_0.812239_2_plen_39_part_01